MSTFLNKSSHLILRVSARASLQIAAVFTTSLFFLFAPWLGFTQSVFVQQNSSDSKVVLEPVADVDAFGDALVPGARLQFGTKRFRPPANVAQVILAPNEGTVVSLCDYLIAWDATTGKERWRVPKMDIHTGTSYGNRPLVFAENGNSFFTIAMNGDVVEWGTETPNPKKRFTVARSNLKSGRASEVASIDMVGNGENFAIGNTDGVTVTDAAGYVVFRIDNGEPNAFPPPRPNEMGRDRLDFHGGYTLVRYAPDKQQLACVFSEAPTEVRLLNAKDGTELSRILLSDRAVRIDHSPDGNQLVVTERDSAVRLYDIRSGKPIWSYIANLKNPYENYTSDVVFSPDGSKVVAGATDNHLYVLDAKNGSEIGQLVDSKLLAIGAADERQVRVSVWEVAMATEVCHWEWGLGKDPHSNIEALAFSSDGRRLAAAVFRQSNAYLWDMQSKEQIAVLKHPQIYGLDFDASGETLVTVGWDSHLREWNAETGELDGDLDCKQERADLRMYAVSCSAAGDFVATAHMNATIKIWNRTDMSLRSEIKVGESFVYGALAFSKDGLWLASGSTSGKISIWDPFTGEKALEVGKHESNAYTVCFGSDLRTLISGGDDGMGFQWDLRRGIGERPLEPDALWEVLRSGSATDAFGVVQALSAKPEVAVDLIARKLNPVLTLADPIGVPDRASLYKKLIGKNDEIEYAIAARRAVTALAQTEGAQARNLLQAFADRGLDDPIGRLAHAAIWGKQKH